MELNVKNLFRIFGALALFFVCAWWGARDYTVDSDSDIWSPSIILDAGHGGEDGGAVSADGIKESLINLEITKKLDQLLILMGHTPVMLREEDISLHDSDAVSLREKKVSDLKNRVSAVSEWPNATLVSIHQNSYPEPKYKGTQVFYAPTGGSEELANSIQHAIIAYLQPQNTREEKPIPDSVYLMNHIKNRAILVECGFLTNPEEASLLLQPDYQCKLALILAAALDQAVV